MSPSPQTVGIFLIPGFALMSYASVVEPLRAANLLAGKDLYRWVHVSPGPEMIAASCGATVPCMAKSGDALNLDLLLVCAGGNPTAFKDRKTLQWLRSLAARGLRIGGVSGGPVILAKAGIMDGHHMTVHWEHAPAVAEAFPNIMLTRSIYIVDRNRLTCAGGTAPLDMMHALIAEAHGPDLARRVSDWFMHTDIRPAQSSQRASLAERHGIHDERLTAALELMESHPGDPLKRGETARRIGLSTRQLDRLFSEKLRRSYSEHYRQIRLERARDLLRQSSIAITEIALGCGFSSASHFSRAYREAFGITPASERRAV
ncbi:GlxA family transcriptional regulator [Aestuariivirga sp.]|uniref:GlxA family transcriptional regulator n=1 Tax=Aestuariivirga sp. TaxID=2650926 RepID=UPI0035937868